MVQRCNHSALNGTGTSTGTEWKLQYHVEIFTLVLDKDRDQDPLFLIVPVAFPVLVLVPCTVGEKKKLDTNKSVFCRT